MIQMFKSCVASFYEGAPVKTQVGNGMYKLFNFQGHKISLYYPEIFFLED